MLTVTKTRTNTERITDSIISIVDSQNWEDCHKEVKELYQSIKSDLTESKQDQLVLDIFLESGSFDSFSEFWNEINR